MYKIGWANGICLNTSLTLEDYEYVFIRAFKSWIDSKSRSFQYNILVGYSPHNSVEKMCKINSYLCTFFKVYEEPVEHIFWYCTVIKKFWDDICTCLWPYMSICQCFWIAKIVFSELQIQHKSANESSIDNIKDIYICLNVRPSQNSEQFFTVRLVSLIPRFHCI